MADSSLPLHRAADATDGDATGERDRVGRRRVLALGAFGALGTLAGCQLPGGTDTEEVSRTYATDRPLVVENANGRIDVTGEDREDVGLTATKRTSYGRQNLDRIAVVGEERTVEGAAAFVVETEFDGQARGSVHLDLRVPRSLPVRTCSTGNGGVTVERVAGDPALDTGNGSVAAIGVEGFVTLESGNGDLEATDVDGFGGAETGNGAVDCDVYAIDGDTTARSGNGDVTLRIGDVDARIVAETGNGDVTVEDLALEATSTADDRVEGRLGEGGPTLRASTGNGDVTLSGVGGEKGTASGS